MDFKERCTDCGCLVEEQKEWFCDEVGKLCKDIVWCPYFGNRY
jgi:hypothetical protein